MQLEVQTKLAQVTGVDVVFLHKNANETRDFSEGTWLKDVRLLGGLRAGFPFFFMVEAIENIVLLSLMAMKLMCDAHSPTVDKILGLIEVLEASTFAVIVKY